MGDLQTIKSHLNTDDERVRDFQRKLYRKAKQEEEFRFYVLYDKVRLSYFLREAYRRCKSNHGACGIDGMSFEDVEEYGVDKFLSEIMEELLNRTYKPSPVLRVYIPKANGKERPLGIPTIKDRVVQMSVKMVIEPIFEADFEDCYYGYRPKRSSGEAVKQIKKNLQEGKTDVPDADLSAYFDSIPHKELLQLIEQNGYCNPTEVVKGLNLKLRGWINYFTIEGVTYPTKAKRDRRYYLFKKLQRYYKRKSQRKSKLYRQGAFKVLVDRYGLIDPTKYPLRRLPVKA